MRIWNGSPRVQCCTLVLLWSGRLCSMAVVHAAAAPPLVGSPQHQHQQRAAKIDQPPSASRNLSPTSVLQRHGDSSIINSWDGSNNINKPPLFLNAIVLVAGGNFLLNIVRPDPSIIWQFRFPRILWEMCIMVTATTAANNNASAPAQSPMTYLLLAFVLGTTALVDIFVWAPLFALWAGVDNQDCSGGFFSGRPYVCRANHIKGYGRLLVTMQSLFGGMFYLSSAISAWGQYVLQRDRLQAEQQARFLHAWQHRQ